MQPRFSSSIPVSSQKLLLIFRNDRNMSRMSSTSSRTQYTFVFIQSDNCLDNLSSLLVLDDKPVVLNNSGCSARKTILHEKYDELQFVQDEQLP